MHHHRLSRVVAIATAVCLSTAVAAFAQTPADNTKVNDRDRAKGSVTADQQKENAGDLDVTQKIRRSLVADKSLSTYAHNIKVITQDGQVTLKGPVRSENEKRVVETKAADIVGAARVTSEISVAPAPAKSGKK